MSRPPAAPARAFAAVALAVALAGCAGMPSGGGVDETPATHDGAGRSGSLARMGDTALRTGDAATAASLFEEALSRDRGNLAAAVGPGNALLTLSRPQDARRAFERALERAAARPRAATASRGR